MWPTVFEEDSRSAKPKNLRQLRDSKKEVKKGKKIYPQAVVFWSDQLQNSESAFGNCWLKKVSGVYQSLFKYVTPVGRGHSASAWIFFWTKMHRYCIISNSLAKTLSSENTLGGNDDIV